MSGACRPRQMFPPPTTTPTCTPRPTTSFSCPATSLVASLEMPKPWSRETNASPESFRSTRRYTGTPGTASSTRRVPDSRADPPGPSPWSLTLRSGLLAQLVADEPADQDILAHFRGNVLHQVVDALRVVADVGLIQQD